METEIDLQRGRGAAAASEAGEKATGTVAAVGAVDAAGKLYLAWQDIDALVQGLAEKLPTHYDAMLVITRGGMVPACLISERTGMRNILVAAVMFYTDVERRLEQPVFLQFPPDPYLNGKKVLVVDDVWDSGRTVVAVRERVLAAGGFPEIAVVHYKPTRSLYPGQEPDYYAQRTDRWIVYPWDPENER